MSLLEALADAQYGGQKPAQMGWSYRSAYPIEPECKCTNEECDWQGLWSDSIESDESYHCPICKHEVDE